MKLTDKIEKLAGKDCSDELAKEIKQLVNDEVETVLKRVQRRATYPAAVGDLIIDWDDAVEIELKALKEKS